MSDDDWYAGTVISSDGRVYRLGRDGFPIEGPPGEVLEELAGLDVPVIDVEPVTVTDSEVQRELD
ncbi:hypothetical protein [Micromonospora sp. NPDC048169]|uniref:hypothetical protein n=1 Tax=Micromonospora sp. NPDC048169 TaxID=3154711 RepID=UPI0033CEF4A9